MSNTVATLLKRRGAELAYVLELENLGLFTTTPDTAGILTAWAGTPFTACKGFLEMPSADTRELDFWLKSIRKTAREFSLVDRDKSLASTFKLGTVLAHLSQDAKPSDATLHLDAVGALPASGTVYVGNDAISYSAVDSTARAITSVTHPGTFGGKASWGHYHRLIASGPLARFGPEVSDAPRSHKGRGVTLYVTAQDPDTGTWVPRASCVVDWVGLVRDITREAGEWTIDCESIESRLDRQLLADQFVAQVAGFYLDAETLTFWPYGDGAATSYTVSLSAGAYALLDLIETINEVLAASSAVMALSLQVNRGDGSYFVQVAITYPDGDPSLNTTYVSVIRSDQVASRILFVLGLVGPRASTWSDSYTTVAASTNNHYESRRHVGPPIKSIFWPDSGELVVSTPTQGTWTPQAVDDVPSSLPSAIASPGFVLVGGAELWLATYTLGTVTRVARWRWDGKPVPAVGTAQVPTIVYWGDDATIEVKQVWLAQSTVGTLISRLLESTGDAGYNDATRDVWPQHMGCAIPSTLVDVDSLAALDAALGASAAEHSLVVTEPVSARELLEGMCRALGFWIAWRGGKLAALLPIAVNGDADWTIDQSNSAGDVGFAAGGDLVVNSISLKFNRDPVANEYQRVVNVYLLTSQTDHDKPDAFEFEAPGLYDYGADKINAVLGHLTAVAQFFAHGAPRYTVADCARTLVGISVGDVVLLSCDDAHDPVGGTYGFSLIYGWVSGYSYDPENAKFDSITVVCPTARPATLAPSAMLDYSRGDKGYAAGVIYLRDHEFSGASDAVDGASFAAGAKIRIVEADAASSGSPTQWTRIAQSVGGSQITLNSALSSPSFDAAKRYYVVQDDYAAATAAEKLAAYQGALGASGYQVAATAPAQLWGIHVKADGAAIDNTVLYRRPVDARQADGAPLSVEILRDLAANMNQLYARITLGNALADMLTASRSVVGFAGPTVYGVRLLAGPYILHAPPGVRSLDVTLLARVSGGTGVFTAYSTMAPITGQDADGGTPAGTVPDLGHTYYSATGTTTSTTLSEVTITLPLLIAPDGTTCLAIACDTLGTQTRYLRGITAAWSKRALT